MIKKSNFRILAIETSCDETAAAVVECVIPTEAEGSLNIRILSNVVASQVKLHAKTFGIVPEVASRCHAEQIVPVIREALKQKAKSKKQNDISKIKNKIDAIAVTNGPGLMGSLLVGVEAAKALAFAWEIPLIAVNHLAGHISAAQVSSRATGGSRPARHQLSLQATAGGGIPFQKVRDPSASHYRDVGRDDSFPFPALALVVSGGHTELVLMKKAGNYKIVGETLDDACGECFDKAARILGLGYPGGPAIAAAAAQIQGVIPSDRRKSRDPFPKSKGSLRSSPRRVGRDDTTLPRPMLNSNNFNFSFSGLKTAVLYASQRAQVSSRANEESRGIPFQDSKGSLRSVAKGDLGRDDNVRCFLAREVQDAIVEVLVKKTLAAAKHFNAKTILVGGGVSANQKLKEEMLAAAERNNIPCYFPEKNLSTDNAAMIGLAAVDLYLRKKFTPWEKIKADSQLSFP